MVHFTWRIGQCPWISFNGPTELKSSSPLLIFCGILISYLFLYKKPTRSGGKLFFINVLLRLDLTFFWWKFTQKEISQYTRFFSFFIYKLHVYALTTVKFLHNSVFILIESILLILPWGACRQTHNFSCIITGKANCLKAINCNNYPNHNALLITHCDFVEGKGASNAWSQ